MKRASDITQGDSSKRMKNSKLNMKKNEEADGDIKQARMQF